MSGYFFIGTMFIEIPVLNANSVDPDQTRQSDLSLHCLPMSILGDARNKWLNMKKSDKSKLIKV